MVMEQNKKVCVKCGKCIEVCAVDARKMEDGEVKVDEELCVDCKACVEVCDCEAIEIPEDQIPKKPEGA
ncbi:MAG: ferredoxin [Planctomycetota bacterium]|nr:MAG: ferredoxin [Planctomycetota bacterium]